ncbi:MAG TPA: tRNA uridine-5-carboxymethylaminomethyl(34) synthesis GTPase MnmE [Candidatus Eisenbacteria bacterium]
MENDTIVAPATAPGESAIAVVRMSGPRALAIAARRFRGKRSPERSASHRILFGTFLGSDDSSLDTVLLSIFRAPHSYTGEDVVEISSHGGAVIPRSVLESLLAAGARPARPGEFTERAYVNGKLDLAQAEAVAALVRARSERASRAAEATLGGALSRRVHELDRSLVPLLAEVEARIDFPNDVDESWDGVSLADRCAVIAAPLREWLAHLPAARRREQGVRVALVGRPNVGKSSLLNALVGFERAIVSDVPGTTRDTVEESIWLEGVEFRLCDAAGVREPTDRLERLGLERTNDAARRADLAILVLDRSDPREREDRAALAVIGDRPVLVAWNKADLTGGSGERSRNGPGATGADAPAEADGLALGIPRGQLLGEVSTIAVRPGGAEPLRAALRASFPRVSGDLPGEELPTTSARQESLLLQAVEALDRAEAGLREDAPYDLIAVDITDSRRALGEIVGRGVDQDVLQAIFSQFCIGK